MKMEETNVHLIEECRRGNRTAQLALYKQFVQRLYVACLRIVGNVPDEEEIRYSVAQVKEACKKLPVGYRVILSLYLFEGYDMEEIASILKIRPSSVRSQYLRAKRKLLDIIAANKENG